jgi:RHS repeat-associated protein
VENRLTSVSGENYGYDPSNKRIQKQLTNGIEEIHFYGAAGERLGIYNLQINGSSVSCGMSSLNIYFGGKRIGRVYSYGNTAFVGLDRLGSDGGLNSYPWGEEKTTTTQNTDKFATYYRDGTGLDYADQRYYSSIMGRFLTPDPYRSGGGSGMPINPQSWNRYAYVLNDPVNFVDPFGLQACTWDGATNTLNCPNDGVGTDTGGLGGGPGRTAGQTALPTDPPPLTGPQRNAMLDILRTLVRQRTETDCDALADYVEAVGQSLENTPARQAQQQIKVALVALTPNQFPVPLIPGVSGNNAYRALNPGNIASGFLPQFQDQIPNADQAHHFAAFFQIGFTYGAGTGAAAATWWERLEGTPGNAGDIALGAAAAQIGANVAAGTLAVNQVGAEIRNDLCRH